MRKIVAVGSAALLSLGLGVATSTAASAETPPAATQQAPAKHTSQTVAPLLKLGSDLGIFTVTTDGGTTWDAATGTISAVVVGNPEASQKVIQRGSVTLTKADGSSLTIKNIKYDVKNGVVTAVIGDERVVLYTAEQTSETTSELYVAPEGGAILRDFINVFGLPADGSHFGTSTLL